MATIALTKQEELLRRFLLDCVTSLPVELRPELRFAGGWVRDKLLRLPSHDIDVALSSMTGADFGKHLKEFASQGNTKRYESEAAALGISVSLRSLNHIAENPEKSKHLATMTTRFLGFDLDFANLRKETYTETSRNPQMEFGTPEEDALRRDATINALFYNLHTEGVEDYTQQGLTDLLRDKIIRTPLAPYQTFKDDPLRVLRLIRFASKFDMEIESQAQAAMKDKSIHQALKVKISRERVGVEVEKMVSGPNPHRALMFIHDLGLYESVFANSNDDFVPELASSSPRIYDGLQIILGNDMISAVLHPKADQALSWYLAAYAAWKDVEPSKVKAAAWEGIKATRENQQIIEKAVANRPQILSLVALAQGTTPPPRRSEIGMAIRRLDPHANTWRPQILYSLLGDLYEHDGASVVRRYETFARYMRQQGLEDVYARTPMINGRKMADVLQTKTGPWMKGALDLVMAWQLDNPERSREDAVEMVKQKRDEILNHNSTTAEQPYCFSISHQDVQQPSSSSSFTPLDSPSFLDLRFRFCDPDQTNPTTTVNNNVSLTTSSSSPRPPTSQHGYPADLAAHISQADEPPTTPTPTPRRRAQTQHARRLRRRRPRRDVSGPVLLYHSVSVSV